MKVPYMLVVGEKEMLENQVSVRRQGKGDLGAQALTDFADSLRAEILERRLE
jgi:threonyl-tRNA synthetase